MGKTNSSCQNKIDRKKCKAQYFSETNNSQLTDCTYLRDTIDQNHFKHLHHVVDWTHGVANLNQPFYIPMKGLYFNKMKENCQEFCEKKKKLLARQRLKRKAEYERTVSAAERIWREQAGESFEENSMEIEVGDVGD